jgi:hypothetical protein
LRRGLTFSDRRYGHRSDSNDERGVVRPIAARIAAGGLVACAGFAGPAGLTNRGLPAVAAFDGDEADESESSDAECELDDDQCHV